MNQAKNKKSIKITLLVLLISIFSLVYLLGNANNGQNLNELRKELSSEFNSVEKIEFWGSSTTLFIYYKVNESVTEIDVEDIFLKTREIILYEKNFNRLVDYHNEKYGGTLIQLHVLFKWKDEGELYQDFYSDSADGVPTTSSFKKWIVDKDGKTSVYIE